MRMFKKGRLAPDVREDSTAVGESTTTGDISDGESTEIDVSEMSDAQIRKAITEQAAQNKKAI